MNAYLVLLIYRPVIPCGYLGVAGTVIGKHKPKKYIGKKYFDLIKM